MIGMTIRNIIIIVLFLRTRIDRSCNSTKSNRTNTPDSWNITNYTM